jgi:hypothetical protein
VYATAGAWDCSIGLSNCHEPLCCGSGCNLPGCFDGVWPAVTHATQGTGCGALSAADADGVLCCRDP